MTIKLSYHYSDLDKEECFGIEVNDFKGWETYVNWFWYQLGKELIEVDKEFTIYPYITDWNKPKILKEYKNCNDAKRQALLIANKIKKQLN